MDTFKLAVEVYSAREGLSSRHVLDEIRHGNTQMSDEVMRLMERVIK